MSSWANKGMESMEAKRMAMDGLNSNAYNRINMNQLETILPGILKLGTLTFKGFIRLHTIYGNMMKHDVYI